MSTAPHLAVVFKDDLVPSVIVEGWPPDTPLPRIVMVNFDMETLDGEHMIAFSDDHDAYCERLELIVYERHHDVLSPKAVFNTLRRTPPMSPRRPGPPANGRTGTPGYRTPTGLPDSQLIFLAGRLCTAIAKQPELADLRKVLLGIGGTELVAPPGEVDPDVPMLVAEGHVMDGLITLVEMRASDCHANVATLWLQRYHYMVGMCSGYALSDDGLWRQHSWGLMRDGILETTALRQVYFGISYCPDMSDRLASAILA